MKSEFGGFVGDEPAAKQSKLNSNLSELQVWIFIILIIMKSRILEIGKTRTTLKQNSLIFFKVCTTVTFYFLKNQFTFKITRAYPSLVFMPYTCATLKRIDFSKE